MISSPKLLLLCTVLCLLFCEAFPKQICCTENNGEYHIYAGCVWATTKNVTSFNQAVEACEEEGGQLITFEKFPTEKDFKNYTSQLTFQKAVVGAKRDGVGNNFIWLTGTILEKSSFLWYSGEPNNNNKQETSCLRLYKGELDDYFCNIFPATKGYCQVFDN